MSPRTPVSASEPVSLTESMQMVDEILSDAQMDRLEKIQRLEEILSAATSDMQFPEDESLTPAKNDELTSNNRHNPCCPCKCHNDYVSNKCKEVEDTDVACQTLSTGDIVITKIWFTAEEKEREKTLSPSPRK